MDEIRYKSEPKIDGKNDIHTIIKVKKILLNLKWLKANFKSLL